MGYYFVIMGFHFHITGFGSNYKRGGGGTKVCPKCLMILGKQSVPKRKCQQLMYNFVLLDVPGPSPSFLVGFQVIFMNLKNIITHCLYMPSGRTESNPLFSLLVMLLLMIKVVYF